MLGLFDAVGGMPADLDLREKKHKEEPISAQELHDMAQVGNTLICTAAADVCFCGSPRCIEVAHGEAVDLEIVG
jgi:hypothetical protein